MSEPLVSVITPIRKGLELEETLASVAAQTLPDWEHLVVGDDADDGAHDSASAVMAARAAEDPRLRYIVREGPCSGDDGCRNLAIRAARAPFVVLLDAGEVLSPDCLERRAAVMSRNADLDFATFQSGVFIDVIGDHRGGPDSQLIGDDLTRFLYLEPPWRLAAPIWRRETLLRLGVFEETLPGWQDIELHVRAIAAGSRYVRYPEVDHHIRRPAEPEKAGAGQGRSPSHLEGALEVIERLEAHVRQGPGMNWVRQRALCSLYFFAAERWVERGDLGQGLAAWRRIRERQLGPQSLHVVGAMLLVARSGLPSETLMRTWKSWARLRSLPEATSA